jgi:ribosome-associated protein YbcJ (S4-like RNA binding protein)
MGLFKFMKEAGAKLFGGGEAKAATPEALKKEVQGHGFDASKIKIDVQGEKVKLSGQAIPRRKQKSSFSLSATRWAWPRSIRAI